MCICVKKLLFPCHPVIGGDRTSLINVVSLISNLLMTQVANTEQNKQKRKNTPKTNTVLYDFTSVINTPDAIRELISVYTVGLHFSRNIFLLSLTPKKGKKKHLYFLKSCNCVHYSNQLLNNVTKRWGKK